jgi:hypothetical protein
MQPDGNYVRIRNDGSSQIRCQEALYELLQSENGDFPVRREVTAA